MRTTYVLQAVAILAMATLGVLPAAGYIGDMSHIVDAQEAALDSIPPAAPTILLEKVVRACDRGVSAEDLGTGKLYFKVRPPRDNRSGPLDFGYIFRDVGGDVPPGFDWPDKPQRAMSRKGYRALAAGEPPESLLTVVIRWPEDMPLHARICPPFRFAVVVSAVDKGGNESAQSDTIWVSDDGYPLPAGPRFPRSSAIK